jgi:hypothetical protein
MTVADKIQKYRLRQIAIEELGLQRAPQTKQGLADSDTPNGSSNVGDRRYPRAPAPGARRCGGGRTRPLLREAGTSSVPTETAVVRPEQTPAPGR